MNRRRIKVLIIKQFTQIRRDRRLLALLLLSPIGQLIILGSAASTDVREIILAVRDRDHTRRSREYVRGLDSSDYFQAVHLAGPAGRDEDELVSGRAGLILTIPPDFSRNLLQGRPAPVQVLVDGADSNFAVQGLNYLLKASQRYSAGLRRAAGDGGKLPTVITATRVWYNPDLNSKHYLIPGTMAMILLVTTMVVTSMTLVKEKEDGTMEQLIVTPLRSTELIVGKLLPFVAIGFAEITLTLPVIIRGFGIHLRGNLLLLYFFSGLFLLTTLGLGLFISTLVKSQQQAMLVASFFVMMPFVLLSGFVFPIANMPTVIRFVAHAIPLKYYLIIIRGIFLKGAGWRELWPDALILLIWGLGILGLAVARSRKRLD